MDDSFYKHTRDIQLDKKGKAVRVTIRSAAEELPPHSEDLSKDIAASLVKYLRKTDRLPFEIVLDYLGEETQSEMPEEAEAADPGETTLMLEKMDPRFELSDFICPPEFRSLLEDVVFYADNLVQISDLLPVPRITRSFLINFFGSSGTGKTMAAEAIAKTLGRDLYVMNYAQIESSLMGKTSRNILAAFQSLDPDRSILMFDEADAFVSRRVTELRQGADYALNAARTQIIRQIDQFGGMIILATNLFGTYDNSILRRIKFNLFFDLPDLEARIYLFRRFLPPSKVIPSYDYETLAEAGSGLTGGDIQNITEIIMMRAVRADQNQFPQPGLEDILEIIGIYKKKSFTRDHLAGRLEVDLRNTTGAARAIEDS